MMPFDFSTIVSVKTIHYEIPVKHALCLVFFVIVSIIAHKSWSFDDISTSCINEDAVNSGYDDISTPLINEGAIRSGYDDISTPEINEGAIKSGYDDITTSRINEGAIDPITKPERRRLFGYEPQDDLGSSNIMDPV